MFPISDIIPSRTRPVVTMSLIALNALMFLYQIRLDAGALQRLVFDYGVIPARFSYPTVVSSMFLHGDFLHVIVNMVFRWSFGDNVEDRLGHGRYSLFYLLSGAAAAALAQAAINPDSILPMVGASGAIAGVMGAYLVLYPRSRIVTLLPILFFIQLVEVPAIFFLGLWFVLQFVSGLGSIASAAAGEPAGGVAFWAHIAGFVAGVSGVIVFRRPERQSVEWWNEINR